MFFCCLPLLEHCPFMLASSGVFIKVGGPPGDLEYFLVSSTEKSMPVVPGVGMVSVAPARYVGTPFLCLF